MFLLAIKIFIDQGHNPGGINAGAQGFGLNEEDITYNVGKYLADMLAADPRFEVRTSRTYPEQVIGSNQSSSLIERVRMANEWPADYFISIHANASVNPALNGSEVYVYQQYSESYYLAEYVLNGIVYYVGTRNNQVRINSSLYVLKRTQMPSILVELGYITNYEDAQKLMNNQYDFAFGIYMGLLQYFGLPAL